MNSLNYIGSKHTLYPELKPHFEKLIRVVEKDGKRVVFGDLFAGTGVVGYNIGTEYNAQIISNDIQNYSFVINTANLSVYTQDDIETINRFVVEYNGIKGLKGFIYNNYCKHERCERMYFSPENAMKIDAVRERLAADRHDMHENVYFYLLANLISSADKVANTSCVYGAYLKEIKKSATKPMLLTCLGPNTKQIKVAGDVYCGNISMVRFPPMDIVYLDPPYNNRQYAPNYHILETIALADEPEIHGKTGLRDYASQKSKFCIKSLVAEEMKKLIASLPARFIAISYNDEGIINKKDFIDLLEEFGTVDVVEIAYKKFKAQAIDSENEKRKIIEYLFILSKTNL